MNSYWKEKWEFVANTNDIFKMLGRSDFDNIMLVNYIQDINKCLFLNKNDYLLDIGCGNGLITSILSIMCKKTLGVDYSKSLIKKAKEYFNNIENLDFLVSDIDDVSLKDVDKVLVGAVFQYLNKDKTKKFLKKLSQSSISRGFICHIPHINKQESFLDGYNILIKDKDKLEDKKSIWKNYMTWYSKKDFELLDKSFKIKFKFPNKRLVQYKYAMDIYIERL